MQGNPRNSGVPQNLWNCGCRGILGIQVFPRICGIVDAGESSEFRCSPESVELWMQGNPRNSGVPQNLWNSGCRGILGIQVFPRICGILDAGESSEFRCSPESVEFWMQGNPRNSGVPQ